MSISRRSFVAALAGSGLAALSRGEESATRPLFRISLAEWSFHRAIFGGTLDHLDFPRTARELGLEGVEYVNQFFMDKARDHAYLAELRSRCEGEGVRSLLIMCDNEGRLGAADDASRREAVERHLKWLEAASYLGCHSIRVNAYGDGEFAERQDRVADGLRRLVERAEPHGLNVLVENHGGLSSNGSWLAGVMRKVDHPRCGTLPDFGNFEGADGKLVYDPYRAIQELMPWAHGVSAKSFDFDADGNETRVDYRRMLGIVLASGYRGWIGIEFEGRDLAEIEGVRATKALLERVRGELA